MRAIPSIRCIQELTIGRDCGQAEVSVGDIVYAQADPKKKERLKK